MGIGGVCLNRGSGELCSATIRRNCCYRVMTTCGVKFGEGQTSSSWPRIFERLSYFFD